MVRQIVSETMMLAVLLLLLELEAEFASISKHRVVCLTDATTSEIACRVDASPTKHPRDRLADAPPLAIDTRPVLMASVCS